MRRNDREITNEIAIEKFIATQQILRIAFYDDGDIYIVPVNYGYINADKYSFYFHGAKAGRKYELAKKSPKVGFEIDGNYTLLESKTACDFSAAFQSVIGTGSLSLVEDTAERRVGLNAVMKQATSKAEWEYSDKMLDSVAVFKLTVDRHKTFEHNTPKTQHFTHPRTFFALKYDSIPAAKKCPIARKLLCFGCEAVF